MISDVFMGLMKLVVLGIFIWGVTEHADRSIELDRTMAEQEKRLQSLRHARQDLVERRRLAESLAMHAETILTFRSARERWSGSETVVTQGTNQFAVEAANRFYCQAWLSMRNIVTNTGAFLGDLQSGECGEVARFHVDDQAREWPQVWTLELNDMRRRVDRKLSDINQMLDQTYGRVTRLHLMGNGYIIIGAVLTVLILIIEFAVSVGNLFKSRGDGRRTSGRTLEIA